MTLQTQIMEVRTSGITFVCKKLGTSNCTMMMMKPLAELTDLELWTFCCIVSVFVSLVSYGIILVKDQMIIQVEILSIHSHSISDTSLVCQN